MDKTKHVCIDGLVENGILLWKKEYAEVYLFMYLF